jgi:antitoxin component YwqK of YwqJK toxin-antitoxin module
MKKVFLAMLLAATCLPSFAQQKTQTLYYDKDWKGVEDKTFATYYRVLSVSEDNGFKKPFRDYYVTGELQGEGYYTYIDKYDDSKSVFDGNLTSYFKNGKVEQQATYANGKLEGTFIRYREDGLIDVKANYKDGKYDGLYTEFTDNGNLCMQAEYVNGVPINDWYMVSDQSGNCSKLRLSDNSPIYETPKLEEKKVEYQNGEAWPYYNKNGITIGMTNNQVKDYGKWYQIPIVFSNNSLYPIDFNPDDIKAVLIDKKGNSTELRVYSANEYMKKVRRSQNWSMALTGIVEGLSAVNAGYSSSTTKTSYSGGSSSHGGAVAFGPGGVAGGGYSEHSRYHGTATSRTTSYDGFAAYQAQVIACERMARYEDALLSERKAKDEGYLKLTTVNPGETISGYVNVERKKGQSLTIYIDVQGAIYEFPWNLNN